MTTIPIISHIQGTVLSIILNKKQTIKSLCENLVKEKVDINKDYLFKILRSLQVKGLIAAWEVPFSNKVLYTPTRKGFSEYVNLLMFYKNKCKILEGHSSRAQYESED